MAAEMLKPSPRDRWEKVLDSSTWWMMALSVCLYLMVSNLIGFWPALAVNVGIAGMVTLALAGMAAPERKARLARDVERGLIECAIRHPNALPGSLSCFW
jgi:hypothetical protein